MTLPLMHPTLAVGFNPRTVKRLFNNLLLLNIVAEQALQDQKYAQPNERMRILFATLCLQNSFQPMYNYLLKAEMSDQLFKKLRLPKALKESKEFAELREELDKSEVFLSKLARFMGVFFVALQLESDPSENPDETMSPEEIATLRSIMSFSAVVAVQENQVQPMSLDDETNTKRHFNRDLIYNLMSEVEVKYQAELKILSSILSEFKPYQPRRAELFLYIEMKSRVAMPIHKLNFEIIFALDTGSLMWSDGKKHIWHSLKQVQNLWFENHLSDLFPEAYAFTFEEVGDVTLFECELSPEISETELEKTFKQSAFEVLDKLLPRLVQLHQEGKL
jgi:hypothetical protein